MWSKIISGMEFQGRMVWARMIGKEKEDAERSSLIIFLLVTILHLENLEQKYRKVAISERLEMFYLQKNAE